MPLQYLRHSGIIDPLVEPFTFADIHDALSQITRFAGHTRFYSVLEHTWLVYYLCPEDNLLRLSALFHDAAEAFTSDIPSMWKTYTQDTLEQRLHTRIREVFSLPELPDVSEYDTRALAIEVGTMWKEPHSNYADSLWSDWRDHVDVRGRACRTAAAPRRWAQEVERLLVRIAVNA